MTARQARSPRPPAGLRDRGKRFWKTVTAAFGLSESEREMLLETCRTLDVIDELEQTIVESGVLAKGSAGQVIVHPAVAEARGQRATLYRLLAALALPDIDGGTLTSPESGRAQAAAAARWAGHVKEQDTG